VDSARRRQSSYLLQVNMQCNLPDAAAFALQLMMKLAMHVLQYTYGAKLHRLSIPEGLDGQICPAE